MLRRDENAKKDVEVERLRMAIRENVVTPEVRANGFGAVDPVRLEEAIAQIALSYTFKMRPKADAAFDPSFLPPLTERRANSPETRRSSRSPGTLLHGVVEPFLEQRADLKVVPVHHHHVAVALMPASGSSRNVPRAAAA